MKQLTIPVTAEALSDWSIRAGHGLSKGIDSAVVRDAAGLPYIPAKTLIGLLRERAEQLADSFTVGDSAVWHEWVTFLFGSQPDRGEGGRQRPVSAALHATPLRLTDALDGEAIAASLGITHQELQRSVTVQRKSVKINAHTGTAADGSLRSEERARAGQVLHGTLTVNFVAEVDATMERLWPMWVLLASTKRLLRSVGGKRRRGAGEFEFTFDAPELELSQLKRYVGPNGFTTNIPAPPTGVTTSNDRGAAALLAEDSWFTARIRTITPLIVGPTKRGTVVTSATYIPGATLLGLMQRTLGWERAAVFQGDVLVTNAYPSSAGTVGVPWPAALTRKKDADHPTLTNKLEPHVFDPKLKPLSDAYFVDRGDGTGSAIRIDHVSRTHVSLEPGRDPELYEYRAVPAGTEFVAHIFCAAGTRTRLPEGHAVETRIGSSRKDDYGLVSVTIDRNGTAPCPPPGAPVSEFTLSLVSDALLVGETGDFSPTPDQLLLELERVLGLEAGTLRVQEAPREDGAFALTQITSVARHESWHTKWGLPRPSLIGLAAGSVFRIASSQEISPEQFLRLQRGIGVRTTEGFGQVVVSPRYLTRPALELIPLDAQQHSAPEIDSALRVAITQDVLDQRVGSYQLPPELIATEISNTQLNKLRSLAENMASQDGQEAIGSWFRKQDSNDFFTSMKHLLSLPTTVESCHTQLKQVGGPLLESLWDPTLEKEKRDTIISDMVQALIMQLVKRSLREKKEAS
ncbi:hypothetical protein FPH17_09180 [Corynebacterium godavarianum]|uniref:CRISPR type III-associated protein domain-containing protein n=1 Tax=Corynebacterium godavarianum TaxID=2054421 RepID=A0ABY3DZQ1_9CORY|nr:RAMP superfamily CRISPR-associated protein [Corynebacterium godavarianum]MBL7284707.1 hypothetical protein [Corynebacterium godavarianum]TSJ72810.1 hypothetical protein FPH17_09180 [Corynebacterium godavarianum]